jgi:hypothetical protein
MIQEEFDEISDLLQKWLSDEDNEERIDLTGVDLTGVDLVKVDLAKVDLTKTNLVGVDLDFSSTLLSCGMSNSKTDERLTKRLIQSITTM